MATDVKIVPTSTIQNIERIQSISIAAGPCPKVNDNGLKGAWWWADKISMAVQVWATAETWKAAKEEYKIAKSYYDLAKKQWDFFYQYYRPLEEQELAEIHAETPYTADYDTAIKGHTNLINGVFGSAENQRKALASKYCVCADVSQFTTTALMKSTIQGDGDNFARRYAEMLAQQKNDMRWAKRVSAAGRGRGLLNTSTTFASKAVGFFSDYASAMGGLASNASAFSEYVRNRNPTTFNSAPTGRVIQVQDGQQANHYRGQFSTYGTAQTGSNADTSSTSIYTTALNAADSINPNTGLDYAYGEGRTPFSASGFDPVGYANYALGINQ